MTVEDLLHKADKLISEELKIELRKQGHYNTGALDQSIEGEVANNHLQGSANYYAVILHHGFGAEKASMRQWPYVKRYFLSKGYDDKEAGNIAAMTINAWKREGMPSTGSFAYSETGERTQVIQIVKKIIMPQVNKVMTTGVDKIVNDKFHETKSETI